ncbi:class I SAM-dependent methyltransferase [Amycolatopsis thermoflava]|uniref:class I SAM-dependent methyltransferase n=1 Tax=Amycolatopsis thermoflava TaxID=84480 RepID=UPI0036477D61
MTRRFYDRLAADYHRIYADWPSSVRRQGEALHRLLGGHPRRVLDCACGIGTQAVGLAAQGHEVTGTDLSPAALARVTGIPVAAADMRALPFPDTTFDAVVCADNSLPHLLTPEDVRRALTEMHRVLRRGGRLIVSTRDYDEARRTHPAATRPSVHEAPDGRTITFQLWHWHPDGTHYDVELFQVFPDLTTTVHTTTYWAITRAELQDFVETTGFSTPTWHEPEESGFFQPILTAKT